MKKVFTLLLMVVCFCGSAIAQKGMSSLGVDIPVNYRKNNVSTGFGINYQYNLSDYLRGEFVGIFSPIHFSSSSSKDYSEGTKMVKNAYVNWKAFLNAHIFFNSPKPTRPYLIIGGGIQGYRYTMANIPYSHAYDYEEGQYTRRAFAVNLGLGLDVRLNYRWTMQIAAIALTAFNNANFEDTQYYGGSLDTNFNDDFTMEATARVGVKYNF